RGRGKQSVADIKSAAGEERSLTRSRCVAQDLSETVADEEISVLGQGHPVADADLRGDGAYDARVLVNPAHASGSGDQKIAVAIEDQRFGNLELRRGGRAAVRRSIGEIAA